MPAACRLASRDSFPAARPLPAATRSYSLMNASR
jgi:hypothetical protein